jgi:hypothetical protein
MTGYRELRHLHRPQLDSIRLEARLARSNDEASVDRLRAEPARSSQDLDLAQGLLAHAHRFVCSAMTLEAALYTATEPAVPTGLEQCVRDVDVTVKRRGPSVCARHCAAMRPHLIHSSRWH